MKTNDLIKADKFYFLRHGESVNNRDELVNGWTDCPLTERGREQARKAANILKTKPISRIVTSDLQRAIETAEIVAKKLKIQIENYKGLRERNWGIYENGPRSVRPRLTETPKGGEAPDEYYSRVMETLLELNIGSNTLIVGHAGTWRTFKILLALQDEEGRMQNAIPAVFYQSDQKWNIEILNE